MPNERKDVAIGNPVDSWMISAWMNALAQHHLYPACKPEQLIAGTEELAVRFEQFDIGLETVRNLHGSDVIPELGVGALRSVIVENEEVADPLIFKIRLVIVRILKHLRTTGVRK